MRLDNVILVGLVCCFVQLPAWSEPVDPCFPADVVEPANERLPNWLPSRIRMLQEEKRRLHAQIETLPQHASKPLPDQLGLHSVPADKLEVSSVAKNQIGVEFEYDPELGAIALAPALVPGVEGSYAFPRRFKIEVEDRNARWIGDTAGAYYIPPPPYEWVEVVNWMDEDFPDPGPYPVFFDIGNIRVHRVRMTVLDGGDYPYHALGEMYLFRHPENSDRLGDNMMDWTTVELSTSNSLSKLPIWHGDYLADGIVGLGIPLSEEVSGEGDFLVSWGSGSVHEDSVQIMMDLGEEHQIGRVQLWPAEAPQGMTIPNFGFPGRVKVELYKSPDFNGTALFSITQLRKNLNQDNLMNILTQGLEARYVRITMDQLATYKGRRILGLGEIRVSEYDEVWSLQCGISAEGIPEEGMEQLPRLVDGFSRKRRILREVEWIRGLARRRPLDRQLILVERELVSAMKAWDELKFKATIWTGTLVGLGLLVAMGLQRLQRRHVLKTLKHRITRDLHDEVGSNLGSITLAARRMEKKGATEEDLMDLSLMTREASASLKDVVWVIDQDSIRLPLLLQKLGERAGRVLNDLDLKIEISDDCPDETVPLTFKRHLNMLFKEAVHNCARHAAADHVWIQLLADHAELRVMIRDDGCGFDPQKVRDGWGVDSMKKRAAEMGGSLKVDSAPGEGTNVQLTVPLSVLKTTTDHQYKTSN